MADLAQYECTDHDMSASLNRKRKKEKKVLNEIFGAHACKPCMDVCDVNNLAFALVYTIKVFLLDYI